VAAKFRKPAIDPIEVVQRPATLRRTLGIRAATSGQVNIERYHARPCAGAPAVVGGIKKSRLLPVMDGSEMRRHAL